jgi:hypothetical protein
VDWLSALEHRNALSEAVGLRSSGLRAFGTEAAEVRSIGHLGWALGFGV